MPSYIVTPDGKCYDSSDFVGVGQGQGIAMRFGSLYFDAADHEYDWAEVEAANADDALQQANTYNWKTVPTSSPEEIAARPPALFSEDLEA